VAEELTVERAMIGLLALMAADRDERVAAHDKSPAPPRRTEVVLADAGLTSQQIGLLLNKKPNSVAKTISRAKQKTQKGADDGD
jgi:DNA-directed RNA polymerase specialized sigma24 family protein